MHQAAWNLSTYLSLCATCCWCPTATQLAKLCSRRFVRSGPNLGQPCLQRQWSPSVSTKPRKENVTSRHTPIANCSEPGVPQSVPLKQLVIANLWINILEQLTDWYNQWYVSHRCFHSVYTFWKDSYFVKRHITRSAILSILMPNATWTKNCGVNTWSKTWQDYSIFLQGWVRSQVRLLMTFHFFKSSWSYALWMLQNPIDGKSTLVQVMTCCLMTLGHYLNQCWMLIYHQ